MEARVRDAMSPGVVTCPAGASVRDVASIMATNRIHCVVVPDVGGRAQAGRSWGVVSDLDLASAVLAGASAGAGRIAATEPVTVDPGASLEHACRLMADHGVSHLLVVGATSPWPAGVVSTLDVAGVVAGLRTGARTPAAR